MADWELTGDEILELLRGNMVQVANYDVTPAAGLDALEVAIAAIRGVARLPVPYDGPPGYVTDRLNDLAKRIEKLEHSAGPGGTMDLEYDRQIEALKARIEKLERIVEYIAPKQWEGR